MAGQIQARNDEVRLGAATQDFVVELERAGRVYTRGTERIHALADVTLRVAAGEMVALVGPSGCGKSTCLNLVSGVDRPDSGSVRVCGVDLSSASPKSLTLLRRRQIGIVFQAFHLVPHLTVAENVALPLALDGRSDPARVRELLGRVGLSQRSSHFPSELSGGEEQRTALARALVHRPRVVLADEPTGNLDSQSGRAVLDLLVEMRAAEGSAVILATHDAQVARRADRVIALADGRMVTPAAEHA